MAVNHLQKSHVTLCIESVDYYAAVLPVGRITRIAPPSVCTSVPYGLVTRKNVEKKSKLV